MIKSTPAGVEVTVRVIPRARANRIDGTRAGALLVRLAAPPVDDLANAALVDLLAGRLGVPRAAVRIVAGARTRSKRVAIVGPTLEAVWRALVEAPGE